jgi:hypothetical protein
MAGLEITTKRLAISKANAQIVGGVAVASFITVFCLVAAKAVYSQNQYQARVTDAKEKAHSQLQKNLRAFDGLNSAYKGFDSTAVNVIGGTRDGAGDNDGPNSKIIVDALPSNYDFPALTSSLEKILADNGLKGGSISGTDDELNQQNNAFSANPSPVEMPFTLSLNNANYDSVKNLISKLQQSIRPIQIDTLNMSGGTSSMTVSITAHTYYQPGKSLTITKKVVK